MHGLLWEMIESAERNDRERMLQLNGMYEILALKAFSEPRTKLDYEYDNCRQSCVLSVTMLKKQHDESVSDAKSRFSRIPKPEY